MKPSLNKHKLKCITLIEVILDAAILASLATVVIMSLLASLRAVTHSSVVSTAAQLANEQIETLRNYSYNDLATQNGAIYPPGNIIDEQTLVKDKKNLKVHTDIRYVDDSYDGNASDAQPDLNPADYKKITVTILEPSTGEKLATLSTDIASRAAETASDTGVLKVTVLDANGLSVANTHVQITNTTTNPNVNMTVETDLNGSIFIPNLPPTTAYHAIATKDGYSSDFTSPITITNPNPTKPDPTVLLQQVSPVTLVIDRVSSLHIQAHNLSENILAADITGTKVINNSPLVYKTIINKNLSSNEVEINNLEFDSYNITPAISWYIKSCYPMLPIGINPDTENVINCYFTNDPLSPRIVSISPQNSPAENNVEFELTGVNLFNNSFYLQKESSPDIIYNNLVTTPEGDSVTGTLDFSALDIGEYDLVYQDTVGREARQTKAITIK
jgi:type II secretory pathway pseudopilin PulG